MNISHQSSGLYTGSQTVTFRIDFKVLLLVYKSFNGLGPQYIADMLTENKPNRSLRSLVVSHQLDIPRVHFKHGHLILAIMPATAGTSFLKRYR